MYSMQTWTAQSRYHHACGRVSELIPHLIHAFAELEAANVGYEQALEADMWQNSAAPAVRNRFLDQIAALRKEHTQIAEALEAMQHAGN